MSSHEPGTPTTELELDDVKAYEVQLPAAVSVKQDFPSFRGQRKFLLLASTPRCGSHYVGHVLKSTNLLGYPLEYFNSVNWSNWAERCQNQEPTTILSKILERRTSPNGVFSAKVHWQHLEHMSTIGLSSVLRKSEVLLIERSDLLGQAISWSIASQTGAWIGGQEERRQPAYQRHHIDKHMRMIVEQNQRWKTLLASMGKIPLIINYERFTEDPAYWTGKVLEFLDIQAVNVVVEPTTKIQRGPRNDRWRRIYLRKKAVDIPHLT